MDAARRRAYLSAMGVSLWEPRFACERVEVALDPPEPDLSVDSAPDLVAAPLDCERAKEPVEFAVAADIAAIDEAPLLVPEPSAGGVATMEWDALAAAVADCRRCALCETRTRTVFGVGHRQARLLIIGEAPGADEDRAGEPFVGRAGQLLNRMLAAIGYARDEVFIANVLKCRPPGNRDPRPEEALQCRDYLTRQVELIQPTLILAVGRIAAQNLLKTDESLGRMRGRWFDFGENAVPLRVTYHPAYLLRSPDQKGKAWEDLTIVKRRLESAGM